MLNTTEVSQVEAAHSAHKPALILGRDGSKAELVEQLPPGVSSSNGLDDCSPGVNSAAEMRGKILALEAVMFRMPQVEIKTTHYFAPGVYMREVFIPKGTTVTGKIHKTEHLNILSQGVLSVWTEDGMKTLTASTVIKSQPGIKRVGFAHEDSVWITVHHNPGDEKDTDKIESLLIAKSFDEVLPFVKPNQIEGGN